jgi:hypothetical protein
MDSTISALKKAEGDFRRLLTLGSDGEIQMLENSLDPSGVKGKIASPNCPSFPVKIEDFGLKYSILKKNPKNLITGRSH